MRAVAPIGAGLLTALLLSSCAAPAENVDDPAAPGDEQETISLTVATVPADSCGQGFIGVDEGIFEEFGLDVTLNVVAGVPELAAAVASGQAELACSAPTAIGSSVIQGLPFTMIAPGIQYVADNPGSYLVVRSDSEIETIEDLEGTTLAVNALNTLPHLSTLAMLEDAGVDSSGVTFVNMPFPNIGQALETNQVDGGILQSPFLDDQINSGAGRVLASQYDYVADSNPFVYTAWFGTNDWAEANSEAVSRFQQAIAAVSEWANDPDNADARRANLTRNTGTTAEALEGTKLSEFATELTIEVVQPQLDLLYRFDLLEEELDAATFITPSGSGS